MKKLNRTLAILATSVVLLSPFAANAQITNSWDNFDNPVIMKMADKNGMLSKADVMKVVGEKFDKMAKDGKISTAQMADLLRDLFKGR
jgi:hypothetical protein